MLLNSLQEEADEELQSELENQISEVSEKLNQFELEILLSGPYDANHAILELLQVPGAWNGITRPGQRCCIVCILVTQNEKDLKWEVLDYLVGEEAGIKSVTIKIKGNNAYGYF